MKFDTQIHYEELENINEGGVQTPSERKSMKAILYDVENGSLFQVNIEDYKDIQRVLAFRNEAPVGFDAVYWKVEDTPVTVYVDDEGLLKEDKTYVNYVNYLCNAVSYDENLSTNPLVGNLLFTMDDEGETIDLDIDIKKIAERIYSFGSVRFGKDINAWESGDIKSMEVL